MAQPGQPPSAAAIKRDPSQYDCRLQGTEDPLSLIKIDFDCRRSWYILVIPQQRGMVLRSKAEIVKTVDAGDAVRTGLAMAGFDIKQLWLRYFALSGMHPLPTIQAYTEGSTHLSAVEHDILAHALNEYLDDQHLDHPVRYSEDL